MRHGSNSKGEARWVASDITTGLVVAARTVAPQPEEREREEKGRKGWAWQAADRTGYRPRRQLTGSLVLTPACACDRPAAQRSHRSLAIIIDSSPARRCPPRPAKEPHR
jgi:hypothetical protein